MKYWWFLNTCCEFKFRGKILVFGSNDLPMPSIQIHKKKKSELASALFRRDVLVLILCALMSAIFEVVVTLYSFCEFFWETKVDLNQTNIPRLSTHHGISLSER